MMSLKQRREVLEAVGRRFPAVLKAGAGKRISIDIVALRPQPARAGKIRLRFDKVVLRLMRDLHAAFETIVPEGLCVALTVTAPIRVAAKTVAALERKVPALANEGPSARDAQLVVYGNRIRIRVLKDKTRRAPKLLGFVHNPDVDAGVLLDIAAEALGNAAGKRKRWLVLAGGAPPYLEVYRSAYQQLHAASGAGKILMVCGDGRVEVLVDTR